MESSIEQNRISFLKEKGLKAFDVKYAMLQTNGFTYNLADSKENTDHKSFKCRKLGKCVRYIKYSITTAKLQKTVFLRSGQI